MAKTTHIAVISIPAFSHQASIVEFSKRLVHLHRHFHVYCIFPTIDAPPPATLAMLESLPSNINYNFLPPVHKQDLSHDDAPSMVQIDLAVSQSMPSFRHMLGSLLSTTPLVALIADPFVASLIFYFLTTFILRYFTTSLLVRTLHQNLL